MEAIKNDKKPNSPSRPKLTQRLGHATFPVNFSKNAAAVSRTAQLLRLLTLAIGIYIAYYYQPFFALIVQSTNRPNLDDSTSISLCASNANIPIAQEDLLKLINAQDVTTKGNETANSRWMEHNMHILESVPLQQLTLPGTHDSAAFRFVGTTLFNVASVIREIVTAANILHIPVESLIKVWSLAQDRTIYDQLLDGIRYLDLRVVWDGNDWRTFHGLTGVLVTEVLSDVSEFLTKFNNELVVLEISVYPGMPGGESCTLLDTVVGQLKPWLIPRSENLSSLLVGDLIRRGQRVLCIMSPDLALEGLPMWESSTIYNTYANTPTLDQMIAYNEARASEATSWSDPHSLYKMSWTLTPSTQTIVSSVLPGKRPKSLQELALQANLKFKEFADEQRQAGRRLGHIVIADYEQKSPLLDVTIAYSVKTAQ